MRPLWSAYWICDDYNHLELVSLPIHYPIFNARTWNNSNNIIGDELLLNICAKFQRLFVISHVKLQNCHGNPSVRLSVKMATKF